MLWIHGTVVWHDVKMRLKGSDGPEGVFGGRIAGFVVVGVTFSLRTHAILVENKA